MPSIKYPPRNGDGSFSCRHKQSVADRPGTRTQVGYKEGDGQRRRTRRRRTELEKAGWVGKKEKCKERAGRGLGTL